MAICIDLMAAVQTSISQGEIRLPLRSSMSIADSENQLLIMPGSLSEPAVFGVKLISLFPHNPSELGLPTIQGQVLLFNSTNGAPIALVEAATLTARRTAAASGAATRVLANPDASRLGLLGYGVQAVTHLEAMRAVRPIEQVRIWGPDPTKAQAFATRYADGIDIIPAETAEGAIRGAELICAVTASRQPIIDGQWVDTGCHINLVGAHSPDAREADSMTMQGARVFTEITEFALKEAGDILLAIADGVLTEDALTEVGAVIAGEATGRTSVDEITVYKSLGNTAQDLISAQHVHDQA